MPKSQTVASTGWAGPSLRRLRGLPPALGPVEAEGRAAGHAVGLDDDAAALLLEQLLTIVRPMPVLSIWSRGFRVWKASKTRAWFLQRDPGVVVRDADPLAVAEVVDDYRQPAGRPIVMFDRLGRPVAAGPLPPRSMPGPAAIHQTSIEKHYQGSGKRWGGGALPDEETTMLSAQEALVYTMVAAAEADHEIDEAEIRIIGDLVNHLPVFRGVDRAAATAIASAGSKQLARPGGRDRVFGLIREALAPQLRDTAYAIACDVIAADSRLRRNELQILEQIRAQLEVEPAMARAIEQIAKVRFQAA